MKKILKAGKLHLLYQDGFLRYISLGDQEIIRMINHAVRDANWTTIPMRIMEEKITEGEDSFHIQYQARFALGEIDFMVQCELIGNDQNELIFNYEGKAINSFRRNRVGFTVLHPVRECAGQPIQIIHPDESVSHSFFPKHISPHQPFKNIRQMKWKVGTLAEALLTFEGEIFETEDQRNWTDASYKTYCTPLEIPFPVELREGELVKQQINLKVNLNKKFHNLDLQEKPGSLLLSENIVGFPNMGTEINVNYLERENWTKYLNQNPWDYFRIELPLDRNFEHSLRILKELRQSQLPIALCVFTDDENWVEKLAALADHFMQVNDLILFSDSQKTTPKHLTDGIPAIRKSFPYWKIYAGTDAFFTELNRNPVDARHLDGVTYSINPQVHAFDDASLVETLETQGDTVESCKNLFPKKEVRICPVTFHMRWNPNITDPNLGFRHPTGWTDPRQYSLFGACWWLISLKYLAESGVSAITYFEAFGETGWLKIQDGRLQKSPAFQLWEELQEFKGGGIRKVKSNRPLLVDAVIFENAEKSCCYVVNWTEQTESIETQEGYVIEKYCERVQEKTGGLKWNRVEDRLPSPFVLLPKSITLFVKTKL